MFFVRSASTRDVAAIRDVLAETWRATYAPFYGAAKVEEIIADWHSEAAIKASLDQPNGEFLVADDGSRIGGFLPAAQLNPAIDEAQGKLKK